MTSSATSEILPAPNDPLGGTMRGVAEEARTMLSLVRTEFQRMLQTEQGRVRRQRQEALDEAFRDCSTPDWDGYGAQPASALSKWWAAGVLACLPGTAGVPEVAFEPDGDAGLEWWQGPDRVLSVSVGRNGEIRYAARLNGTRIIGTEMFADGVSRRLADLVDELAA